MDTKEMTKPVKNLKIPTSHLIQIMESLDKSIDNLNDTIRIYKNKKFKAPKGFHQTLKKWKARKERSRAFIQKQYEMQMFPTIFGDKVWRPKK